MKSSFHENIDFGFRLEIRTLPSFIVYTPVLLQTFRGSSVMTSSFQKVYGSIKSFLLVGFRVIHKSDGSYFRYQKSVNCLPRSSATFFRILRNLLRTRFMFIHRFSFVLYQTRRLTIKLRVSK